METKLNLEVLKIIIEEVTGKDVEIKGCWRDAGQGIWHTTLVMESDSGMRVQILNPREQERAEAGILDKEEAKEIVRRVKVL